MESSISGPRALSPTPTSLSIKPPRITRILCAHLFRILDVTKQVLVGEGEPAHFECAVDANPLTSTTIRWERPGYDMAGKTKTAKGSPAATKSIYSGDGGDDDNVGVVLLTVLNATAADSGMFYCVADNGIDGSRIVRNATYLLVRRKIICPFYLSSAFMNRFTSKSSLDFLTPSDLWVTGSEINFWLDSLALPKPSNIRGISTFPFPIFSPRIVPSSHFFLPCSISRRNDMTAWWKKSLSPSASDD